MPEVLTKVDLDDPIEKLIGRELDAAVAATVMSVACDCERTPDGSQWCHRHGTGDGIGSRPCSTSIEAAMEVVEKMWRSGWSIEMANCGKIGTIASDRTVIWYVRFIEDENDMNNWSAEAETLPVAICRAALKAAGAE